MLNTLRCHHFKLCRANFGSGAGKTCVKNFENLLVPHDPNRPVPRPAGSEQSQGECGPPQGGATLPLGLRAGCRDMRSRHSSRWQEDAYASHYLGFSGFRSLGISVGR